MSLDWNLGMRISFNAARSKIAFSTRSLLFLLCAISQLLGEVKRIGLFIGVNTGLNDEQKLKYADIDARKMSKLFREYGKMENENIHLLENPSINQVQLLQAKVNRNIAEMKKKGDDPFVFFFYSGHGSKNALHIQNKLFERKELLNYFNSLQAGMKILVVDACESGTLLRTKGGVVKSGHFINKDDDLGTLGSIIISSSASEEASHESEQYQGAVFSHHFMNGLKGLADYNGDRRITLLENFQYAKFATLNENIWGQINSQHPGFDMDVVGEGDIDLAFLPTSLVGIRLKNMPPIKMDVYNKISGALYSQVLLPGIKDVDLALPRGRYILTYEDKEKLYTAEINLDWKSKNIHTVQSWDFITQQHSIVYAKGGRRLVINPRVVTATKRAQRIKDAPSNITVITREQIKDWGSRDLKDVLSRVAGFPVIADRDEWVFAARGNISDNNNKYLILLDGHRMNSKENFGAAHFIELPNDLSMVKRIEIIRGPGSVVWGPDALAGVINIITITTKDLEPYSTNLSAQGGENGYMTSDFQTGLELGENNGLTLMGSWAKHDGVPILQSASTSFPELLSKSDQAKDPFGIYRTHLDKMQPGFMLYAKSTVGNFNLSALSFKTSIFNRHYESNMGREQYFSTHKSFLEGGYQKKIKDNFDLSLKLSTDLNRMEYFSLKQGDQSNKLPFNLVWLDQQYTANLELGGELAKGITFSLGLDGTRAYLGPNQRIEQLNAEDPTNTIQIISPDTLFPGKSIPRTGFWLDKYLEENAWGGYLQGDWQIFNWMIINLGLRGDYNGKRGAEKTNINPRAGIILSPFTETTIKLLYNRGFLRPTNFQTGPFVDSERMDQVDLIFMQTLGSFYFMADLYWQQLSGFILFEPKFDKGFKNTGDYESKGIELETNFTLLDNFELWANGYYSLAIGKNFNSQLDHNLVRVDLDNRLLSYPSYMINVGGTFHKNGFYISPAYSYVPNIKYRAKTPDSPSHVNSHTMLKYHDHEGNYAESLPVHYVHLNIGYQFSERIESNVYIDNWLDERHQLPISVWNGTRGIYGRHVSGKVSVRF